MINYDELGREREQSSLPAMLADDSISVLEYINFCYEQSEKWIAKAEELQDGLV